MGGRKDNFDLTPSTTSQYSSWFPSQPVIEKRFLAFLLIICWAPLPLGSNRPWSWSLLSLLCLLVAGFILWDAYRKNKLIENVAPYRRGILLLLGIPVFATLQIIPLPSGVIELLSPAALDLHTSTLDRSFLPLSIDPARTQQMVILSWAYWAYFVAGLTIIDSTRKLRILLWVVAGCGVFQAVYGSLMTLSGIEYSFFMEKTAYVGFATGTFINRNHLAGYLEMALACGVGLLIASLQMQKSRDWGVWFQRLLDTLLGPKIFLRLGLALMVVALVLTRSRMGNVAFFASLPLCGALMLILQRKFNRNVIFLLVSLIAIDMFILGDWFGIEEVAQRIQTTDYLAEGRDEVAMDSISIIREYPFFGTGLGTFFSIFPGYQSMGTSSYYTHAHNDYLEFVLMLGLFGTLPAAALLLYVLGNNLRAMVIRKNRLCQGAVFASTMGVVSILIHGFFDFNLQIPANSLLFVTLLMIGLLAGRVKSESRRINLVRY